MSKSLQFPADADLFICDPFYFQDPCHKIKIRMPEGKYTHRVHISLKQHEPEKVCAIGMYKGFAPKDENLKKLGEIPVVSGMAGFFTVFPYDLMNTTDREFFCRCVPFSDLGTRNSETSFMFCVPKHCRACAIYAVTDPDTGKITALKIEAM